MPRVSSSTLGFGTESARRALVVACQSAGLDHAGAELIRFGENALFRLVSTPVVVRIARTKDYWSDAVNEVNVAGWLARHGLDAATACDVPQPVDALGHPVTFWDFIAGRPGGPKDIGTLGAVLRRLHVLPPPTTFALPEEDILGRVGSRIETAPVSRDDKQFLTRRLQELRAQIADLRYPLSPSPTHGDAHSENLMIQDGKPILIDFERFAWGQPEWDLAMTATEYASAGWWSSSEYQEFSDAYGYDVMSWDGFPILQAAHELKMTTWLMQNVQESDEISEEFRVRMRAIRGGRPRETWRPF